MYNNLKAEMARTGITGNDIAKLLEISLNTTYAKLNGKTDFYNNETFSIKEKFFPELEFEYLFKKDEN